MTVRETAKLLMFITALYPTIKVKEGTVKAWHEMLGDLPYDVASTALKQVLATHDGAYMPAVGKIREAAAKLTKPAIPTAVEAWVMVRTALRRYRCINYPGGAMPNERGKAEASLPPIVAQAARQLGWDRLSLDNNQDKLYRDFVFAYNDNAEIAGKEEQYIEPAVSRDMLQTLGLGVSDGNGESALPPTHPAQLPTTTRIA